MPDIKRVRQSIVQTLQEGLAKFVTARMEELGLSTYDVARNSGGAITHQTVWTLANGTGSGDVKLSTIEALARGLRVTAEAVLNAARGKEQVDPKFEKSEIAALFYDYEKLADGDKQELQAIWDMLKADIKRRKKKIGK